jgi:nucleotide-binding universal stress UspA family protein
VTANGGAIVACVDGSDLALAAVQEGLSLVAPEERVVLVTVVEDNDVTLVTGGGHTGGVMSAEEFDQLERAGQADARKVLDRAAAAIGSERTETRVLRGDPGRALCAFAGELPARALVMGSRGFGGIRRAVLGSVSDYVVRNAPCPVIITGSSG